MIDLDAVERRYQKALKAKPSKGRITDIDSLTDSVSDVPGLVKEIKRLNVVVDELYDGASYSNAEARADAEVSRYKISVTSFHFPDDA